MAFCPEVVTGVVGRGQWKSLKLSLPAKIANQEQCPTAGESPKVKGHHQNPERHRDGESMTYSSTSLVWLMLKLVCLSGRLSLHAASAPNVLSHLIQSIHLLIIGMQLLTHWTPFFL